MKTYFVLSILTLTVALIALLVLGRFASAEVINSAIVYIDALLVSAFVLGVLYMTTSNKASKR